MVKNEWGYTFAPSYAFMECTGKIVAHFASTVSCYQVGREIEYLYSDNKECLFITHTVEHNYTGLFKMTVGVLTTCHTQYT